MCMETNLLGYACAIVTKQIEAFSKCLAVKKLQKISFFNAVLIEFSKMAVADKVTIKGSAISVGNMTRKVMKTAIKQL